MEAEENAARSETPCRNLRNKAMYYGAEDEDGAYWCAQTQDSFGPDGAPTGKTECCSGRSCYVG